MRIIQLTLSLILFASSLHAQANRGEEVGEIKPQLVSRLEKPNCEYLLMNIDSFSNALQNDPNSTGYVITYGGNRAVARAERRMRKQILGRGFSLDRLVFVNGGGKDDLETIELWSVPPGAEPPSPQPPRETQSTIDTESEVAAEPTKPYIHSSEFADGVAGCTEELEIEHYAETLKANSKRRGNIVIYETSRRSFREREKEILDDLMKSGVVRQRLKTFFVRVTPNRQLNGAELWVLP